MKKWYTGVVHSHTTRSDGILSPEELIALAEKIGLDFIMITDHNVNCDVVPHSDKVLVIPGAEITDDKWGHTNVWGVKTPVDGYVCDGYEDWEKKITLARERGATICMNHPWCSNCGWHWPLEPEKVDCVEIWNSPQHTDNMICTEWWQNQLREGKKIPAVGGSDFHRSYYVLGHLDNPVTLVYAEECTQDAILEAIREGHTTIAPCVGGQMIEITSGDAIIGDTVKLTEDTSFTVKVSELKRNQRLKVVYGSGVVYTHTAKKTGPFSITLPVRTKGFVCAQVEHDLNPVFEKVYSKVEKVILHGKEYDKLPPFITAQTGAIYFE